MNSDVLHWLHAQLGPDIDAANLVSRYERLGSARAVALEVLHERTAALLADPLKVTVNGVVTIDNSANVSALERQAARISAAEAPDDLSPMQGGTLIAVQLHTRARR
ncbi:hypothetical protein [Streptomyces alanosinicus]|uniref:Uncharacterized protein n=1 Tax=Streptomyces alanosinicus TaxID=68171 RepID=A0A918YQ01_9ACTN|nr:hypothetical protein [Streptomyces alanosinicus]GHE11387.1 hypothetical protein GCM10010339_70980 [Streptomyces alanosinicus]